MTPKALICYAICRVTTRQEAKRMKRKKSFAKLIKHLRDKKGWTQERLARELDVSLSSVQRWEAGGFNPSRLARRFLDKLFVEEGIEVEKR